MRCRPCSCFPLFLLFFLKGRRKQALLLCAIPFLCWGAVTFSLTAALHAQGGENQEVLTVPIQQLARCFVYEGDTFSPADRDAMDALMPEKDWMLYTPKVSDGVKIHSTMRFLKRTGSSTPICGSGWDWAHPAVYLNAWFLTSYGFWYPDAVIDCYQGNAVFTFTYADSSYFGYETEKPGERQSLFPAVDAFLPLDLPGPRGTGRSRSCIFCFRPGPCSGFLRLSWCSASMRAGWYRSALSCRCS
jgi:hypothetical protein